MLLNLTNHPSTYWSDEQKNTAIEKYGCIQDLTFPQIDPSWDETQIDQLVNEYEKKIKAISPTAVHLMGEMTFTFRLVNRLKALGIDCIASTSERIAKEDGFGNKSSSFHFIQFRNY